MGKDQGSLFKESRKITEMPFYTICWEDEENGILYTKSNPTGNITIQDIINAFEVYKNDYKHHHRKLLTDITERNTLSKEARNFVIGPNGIFNHFEAIAVLDRSKFSTTALVAHVLTKTIPLPKPVKVFHKKQEAIDWLKKL